jgi:polygalacturonase
MKNLTFTVILIVLATIAKGQQKTDIFNIKSFGAVGDSITLETEAVQAAIDACNKNGGGTVWVPAGNFVIGTIELKSNITLSLDHGASLLGSQDHKNYPIDKLRPAREGNSECLLYAADANNIKIEGLGVIDGRGLPEFFPKNAGVGGKDNRPRLLRFESCKNVSFSGLTYLRPAFWGLHLVDCSNVHLNGVKIDFRNNGANNDGLDIDGCEDVLIENCNINSGDDGICLKSSLNACKNFVVRNCIVSSHTAPLKFGTSSSGGFINVKVENCYFYDCPMGAIKLQIVDGGTMENIDISRIKVVNGGSPVFIRLGNRGRIYTQNTYTGTDKINGTKPEGAPVGSIKNIRISDVVAEVNFPDREHDLKATYKKVNYESEEKTEREKAQAGPIMITGIPGHYIENVTLENISITYTGEGTETNAVVPEDINRYPEQYFFGVLPAWGAYIRHAKNVQFKNVKMTTRASDKREMIVLDDVEGFINE